MAQKNSQYVVKSLPSLYPSQFHHQASGIISFLCILSELIYAQIREFEYILSPLLHKR